MSARKAPRSASGPPWWLIILIAALLAVLAFYLWNRHQTFDSARHGGTAQSSDAAGAGSEPGVPGSGAGSGARGSSGAAAGVAGSGGPSGAAGGNAESGIQGSDGAFSGRTDDGSSSGRGGEASSGARGSTAASGAALGGPGRAGRTDDSGPGTTAASSGPHDTRGDSRQDAEAGGAAVDSGSAASPPGGAGALQAGADAAVKSGPKYPLPEQAERSDAAPLPDLAESDLPILGELLSLGDRKPLVEYGNLQDLTRRFVVTVDHLPREMIPARYSALQRIPGALRVATQGKTIVLKPENFERYTAFVAFAESLGSKPMVAIYLHFYPLLQQEYRAMGFPNGYFNDRVIEAIDDMLAAPQVSGPIELVQPRVHYRFADPALESLSAGRKIMIRIGPENAARLKKVLQGIRARLVQ